MTRTSSPVVLTDLRPLHHPRRKPSCYWPYVLIAVGLFLLAVAGHCAG